MASMLAMFPSNIAARLKSLPQIASRQLSLASRTDFVCTSVSHEKLQAIMYEVLHLASRPSVFFVLSRRSWIDRDRYLACALFWSSA